MAGCHQIHDNLVEPALLTGVPHTGPCNAERLWGILTANIAGVVGG